VSKRDGERVVLHTVNERVYVCASLQFGTAKYMCFVHVCHNNSQTTSMGCNIDVSCVRSVSIPRKTSCTVAKDWAEFESSAAHPFKK
jgi:hypothetical protein